MIKLFNTGSHRLMTFLAIGVAAVLAGIAGAYVIADHDDDGLAAPSCQNALAAAARAKPFATGEVAAFLPASKPLSVADLSFKGNTGEDMTLADFKGRTTLLNIWATWCAPCRKEMPALDLLQAELGADDFEVVAVNVDRGPEEKARGFLKEVGVETLNFYADPTMKIFNELRSRGKGAGLPTTMLIDGQGCEIGSMFGPAEWASADAKNLIKAVLNKEK